MRLLLDTHTLLWWHAETASLSETARDAVENAENDVFLCVVSAWEMQIKAQLGKLPLPGTVAELVEEEMQANGFQPLLVHFDHVYALGALPPRHKDPFDRLLVAQAQHEDMTLVSDDVQVREYDVPILW